MGLKKIFAKITYRDQPSRVNPVRVQQSMKVMKNRTEPVMDVSRRAGQ